MIVRGAVAGVALFGILCALMPDRATKDLTDTAYGWALIAALAVGAYVAVWA